MTTNELQEALGLSLLAGGTDPKPVDGLYIGDLLSWVMGRAQEGNAWITVMGNVNAIAVAKLADLSCVILCENAHLDDEAKQQADANGIQVFAGSDPAHTLAFRAGKALGLV
ncbi:hypothetical protein LJC63_08700 [Ruminococcaceae bacterium OttesenSCG-928-L11]|nr:hypothetical protein [Ruminococcaceae bacterium OttesenSCG-928-L11]